MKKFFIALSIVGLFWVSTKVSACFFDHGNFPSFQHHQYNQKNNSNDSYREYNCGNPNCNIKGYHTHETHHNTYHNNDQATYHYGGHHSSHHH